MRMISEESNTDKSPTVLSTTGAVPPPIMSLSTDAVFLNMKLDARSIACIASSLEAYVSQFSMLDVGFESVEFDHSPTDQKFKNKPVATMVVDTMKFHLWGSVTTSPVVGALPLTHMFGLTFYLVPGSRATIGGALDAPCAPSIGCLSVPVDKAFLFVMESETVPWQLPESFHIKPSIGEDTSLPCAAPVVDGQPVGLTVTTRDPWRVTWPVSKSFIVPHAECVGLENEMITRSYCKTEIKKPQPKAKAKAAPKAKAKGKGKGRGASTSTGGDDQPQPPVDAAAGPPAVNSTDSSTPVVVSATS